MRIISQNGIYDLHYEMCLIWLNKNNIMASPIGDPDSDYTMAIYSTQEKTKSSMELLHKEYLNHDKCHYTMNQNQGMYGMPASELAMNVGFIPPKVFQFPKEEDL